MEHRGKKICELQFRHFVWMVSYLGKPIAAISYAQKFSRRFFANKFHVAK